jgi:beta-glucosidase/6-phospho-beta-glucosidase/beta-galactosidase
LRAPVTTEGRRAVEFVGAFESTYQPEHDVDGMETTGHHRRWRSDLALLRRTGVRRLRYPVRWHRVERRPGAYDWAHTDRVFEWMAAAGMVPIVDLLHHTSYPRWIDGFTDPAFGPAYLGFVEQVARRYPWIAEYTLCNEPFTTFLLSGHEGIWPPHRTGMSGFVEVTRAVLPVLAEASRRCRELLPEARHVWVDVCERHTAPTLEGVAYAAFANDRRFFVLDAFLGRPLDPARPFVRAVAEAGGDDLVTLDPGHVDVVGLDYYAHCQWEFTGPHGEGRMHTRTPTPLAALIVEYAERYQRPVALTETNIRGYASDRAGWLKYTLEQCELARDAGVDVDGYCWFPFVDSCDWDSVLCRCEGNVDPVGVYWLDDSLRRRPSCMSESYSRAARGAPAAALPAYRFRPPVAGWLRGWLPQMAHWDWEEPPVYPSDPPPPVGPVELRIPDVVE